MSFEARQMQDANSSTTAGTDWLTDLYLRIPDAVPMQVSPQDKALTLVVSNLRAHHAQLELAGLNPGAIAPGDFASTLELRDPEGNLVLLTQPGRV